jgi:hypothetical protein
MVNNSRVSHEHPLSAATGIEGESQTGCFLKRCLALRVIDLFEGAHSACGWGHFKRRKIQVFAKKKTAMPRLLLRIRQQI